MKLEFFLIILVSLLFTNHKNFAQKTNFELVDSLVQMSAKLIAENENSQNTFALEFSGSSDYQVLKAKVIASLQKNGFELMDDSENVKVINYNLDEAKTRYSKIFKDGFLGGYLVERIANLKGSYFIINSKNIEESKDFDFTLSDSVYFSDISSLENIAYSFTRADLPEEPFFASTLEPVIAIGTAAVAVYLFFNIRSK